MPLSPELALWLRMQGHDAVHAGEIALARAPDIEILNAAIHESRVVITADLDFPRLLALLGARGPGLLLLRGGNFTGSECEIGLAGPWHRSQSRRCQTKRARPLSPLPPAGCTINQTDQSIF